MKFDALIFDLDDTLIDTKKRHYQVIIDFMVLHKISLCFSFEEYVRIRRENHFSNLELLKYYYPKENIENKLQTFWNKNIESSEYLSLDEIIVDINLLKKISITSDLYILSLRSNYNNALNQIKKFPFNSLVQNIFLPHQHNKNPKIKELLKLKKEYKEILFIGDTDSDKEAALQASVNFIKVQSGFYKTDTTNSFLNVNTYLNNLLNV